MYRKEGSRYLGTFSGKIESSVAECSFSIDDGSAGNLKIYFTENGRLEASIKFLQKEKYDEVISDIIYYFRPYNIENDIEYIPEKEIKVSTDLNSWGDVYIVAELMQNSPAAFITDADGNILYCFWPGITGTEIAQIYVEDINGNSLKDIRFLIKAIDAKDDDDFELWFEYIQMENGLFYSSSLDE